MSLRLPPPPRVSCAKLCSPSSSPAPPLSFLLSGAGKLRGSNKLPRLVPKVTPFRVSSAPTPASFSSSSFDASVLSTSVVSSPPATIQLAQWRLGRDHLTVLNVSACVVAIAASWLFVAAIPTLLAFKKAAESLEKLLDMAAEELPDTMAAMRLSGMEISDLTMELSDLGQELTRGVRRSTRFVHVAEEQLRKLTNRTPADSLQNQMTMTDEMEGRPAIARTARNLRVGIAKSRAAFGMMFSVAHCLRWASSILGKCVKTAGM